MRKQSLAYYIARTIQRFTLCTAVGATIIHWIILISGTASLQITGNLQNHTYKDSQALNDTIRQVNNTQSLIVLRWLILASVLTFALLLIKRFRKYDKGLIVDSFAILLFCLASVALSSAILRVFLQRF